MNDSFHFILTQLRREKGVSQKLAAAELGTSQALLSHYENGVRECGLDFVVRAARFYGVTCDYLLGNSTSRDGLPAYSETALACTEQLGQISGGIILNAVNSLLAQAESAEEPRRSELKACLVLALYRILLANTPDSSGDGSQLSQALLCDTMLKVKEACLLNQPGAEPLEAPADTPLGTLAESARLYLAEAQAQLNHSLL